MTKEEAIVELYEKLNKEYSELSGVSIGTTEDYKDENWKTLRVELASEKDIMPAFTWANRTLTDHFAETFNRPGVYDILFCVSYRGEFDESEEGVANRARIKEAQKQMGIKANLELAKIEAEYAEKTDEGVH